MMKCRLFSALLLLFILMAAGCSGQPAAVTADDLADQVYICLLYTSPSPRDCS